eukprot:1156244-Pelagomonas_calceolata.AAC.10
MDGPLPFAPPPYTCPKQQCHQKFQPLTCIPKRLLPFCSRRHSSSSSTSAGAATRDCSAAEL